MTDVKITAGDVFAARDYVRDKIDGYGFATVLADQTEDGDPRFAMIDPDEGDVWIVTVTRGELVAGGQDSS